MKPLDQLVWVDVETSGLGRGVQILELGIAVTTAYSLEIRSEASWIVKPKGGLQALHPVVLDMHSKSGLLAELHAGAPIDVVDILAAAFVRVHGAAGGPMCGSSVHTDKAWIEEHMPLLSACFNHRVFDASTLKQARCQVEGKESPNADREPKHRVIDDIRESIEVAREALLRPWPAYRVGS